MAKKNTGISGESVALAFVGIGLAWAYLMPNAFGAITPYLSAVLILFGFAGFMIELQKRFENTNFRWDNGGVGILLGALGGYLTYTSYYHLSGFWRGLAVLVLSTALLFASAAMLDFIISIFEFLVHKKAGIQGKTIGFLKFITLLVSTAAAVYTSLSQLIG